MPQNDGEIRVEITGDSSKIKKELKETKSAVKNTADSISEMTSALEDISGTGDNFNDVAESVNNVAESAENAADAVSDTADKVNNLGDSIKNAGDKTVTFGDLLKANLLSDYIQKGIGKLADVFGDFSKKAFPLLPICRKSKTLSTLLSGTVRSRYIHGRKLPRKASVCPPCRRRISTVRWALC